jgi:undecaprenyl-diphosphatase
MIGGIGDIAKNDMNAEGSRLVFNLITGSIPVLIAGFALNIWQPDWLLQVEILAWATLIFGALLWFADRTPDTTRTVKDMGLKHALIIGLTQALALVPGTSRSGITMTAARFLGYSRAESAHFSLLLAIVAISGAGALSINELIQTGNMEIGMDFIIAIALSFITGLVAITLMMKWLERSTFLPFVIYRLILGSVLLGLIYSGVISS